MTEEDESAKVSEKEKLTEKEKEDITVRCDSLVRRLLDVYLIICRSLIFNEGRALDFLKLLTDYLYNLEFMIETKQKLGDVLSDLAIKRGEGRVDRDFFFSIDFRCRLTLSRMNISDIHTKIKAKSLMLKGLLLVRKEGLEFVNAVNTKSGLYYLDLQEELREANRAIEDIDRYLENIEKVDFKESVKRLIDKDASLMNLEHRRDEFNSEAEIRILEEEREKFLKESK